LYLHNWTYHKKQIKNFTHHDQAVGKDNLWLTCISTHYNGQVMRKLEITGFVKTEKAGQAMLANEVGHMQNRAEKLVDQVCKPE